MTWASHLALTDETGGQFHYAQRAEIGPQVNAGGGGGDRLRPRDPRPRPRGPDDLHAGRPGRWRAPAATDTPRGGGAARRRSLGDPSSGFGLDARDLAATKPPALHDGDGYIDFGPAGGSYYYSRTAMTATGHRSRWAARTLDGRRAAPGSTTSGATSSRSAPAAGTGSRSTSTTARTSRSRWCARPTASYPLVYGTLVDADGRDAAPRRRRLHGGRDRRTGRARRPAPTYPAGWTVAIPGGSWIDRAARPSVPQQELDTRATTGRRVLGGLAARDRDAGRRSRSAARPTWS